MPDAIDINRFFEQLDDSRSRASVASVFGAPIVANGQTLIPIASAAYGFGMGAGSAAGETSEGSANAGLGGGSGYLARPIAMAVVDADGVHIEPIRNEGRLALAGILLSGWAIFWSARVLLRLIGKR